MYFLFREKNIMPGDFIKMSPGEKLILRAFFEKQTEEKEFIRRSQNI